MPEITIEQIDAKQTELAQLIEKFKQQPKPTTVLLPAAQIALNPGERYVGPVLNADGSIKYHLILVAVQASGLDYEDANAWAGSKGGELASKDAEMRLVQANAADLLPDSGWCWLKETNGSSYAWYCDFNGGNINFNNRSSEGGAVAVRRFLP